MNQGMALIFDLDGVIVDSNAVHTRAWREYLRRLGLEADEGMPLRMFGKHNDDIVRDLIGSHLSDEEVAAHGAAKERLYREMLEPELRERLVPGVTRFLERHKAAPIALATNAEPANVDFVLKNARLRDYFRVILDGQQVDRPKPAPDIFLEAARLLGAEPANCVIFEDSYSGAKAARSAGARVVGVATTHAELPEADLTVRDFHSPELEPWLLAQRPRA